MGKVFIHDQTSETFGVKTSNAKLTVYCPSGSIITVTSDQNEYTKASDSSDKAIFYGLTHGTWRVTATDGIHAYEESIDISTDYDLTLDFFSATIIIRYPYGSTCTCSNGTTVYTAPDVSGLWTCNIPCAGTWSITCTDGSLTKTETVEITNEGQELAVSVDYFTAIINVTYPNGAVCSCSNEGTIYSASDTNGNWSFSVHEVGAWVIKVTDNIQTITKVVNITTDGQVESVTVKFFASTINITYPAGAVCVCSDGITNFTAPDTSGKWTVTVPRIGTWRIEATKDTNSDVETVEITEDGQTVDVTCIFFISYVNVTYPSETFKVVLWYIDSYGNKVEKGVDTSASGTRKFTVTQAGEYEIGGYRVSPYVGIEDSAGDYDSATVTISASGQTVAVTLSYNTIPEFTYNGTYKIVNDAGENINQTTGNWNIMLLTGGTFKATKLNGAKSGIDVFAVGGGGNGGNVLIGTAGGEEYSSGGGGGGGGHREIGSNIKITENTGYEIEIGGAGGTTSAFNVSASAGSNGSNATATNDVDGGGDGGSGGSQGGKGGVMANTPSNCNGADGSYPFNGTSGVRYGPGGGGGRGYNGHTGMSSNTAYGGKDGGGNSNTNATANSGGGGGGASRTSSGTLAAGKGGSGIVIIRNKR